eukprot:2753080-Rhodomonas_salina.1
MSSGAADHTSEPRQPLELETHQKNFAKFCSNTRLNGSRQVWILLAFHVEIPARPSLATRPSLPETIRKVNGCRFGMLKEATTKQKQSSDPFR